MKKSLPKLSKREFEIFSLLINGHPTSFIAKKLNLNSNTISTYKRIIYYKTGTNNVIELFKLAVKYKIIIL